MDIKALMDIIEEHCEIVTQKQYDELYAALESAVRQMEGAPAAQN